ncbi:MAG: glycerol-3-phosphate 1-O-acyltransferase PlsY [Rhodospirillaceae bacterium]|jgi:acyl phosphate:glycerol-3-phosphate acyltransferase|nr:glycerol-3-phosphate 1-O-acyltransferase PlsY [Rhodospirillaceae bacterium]
MPDLLGDFSFTWPFYLGAVLAYLLGSIPFGVVLTRLAGLGDIRRIGSGNIGATNVLRTGSKKLAAATLVLDLAKGAAAVLIAKTYGPDMAVFAAMGVVLGHCFPVWLKFKGGKGVSTGIGVYLALDPLLGAATIATWLVVVFVSRYSSLAALLAYLAAPVFAWWLVDPQTMELTLVIGALIYLRHRDNIKRLIFGEESKVSFKKSE